MSDILDEIERAREKRFNSDQFSEPWRPEPEPQAPPGGWKLRIAEPDIDDAEKIHVVEALRRTWISGASPIIAGVEGDFAKFCGTRYAVACNSGGSALHLLMRALDYPPGSEIICPSFTMIATAAAISLAGHVPVFVDCEPDHLTINPDRVLAAITPKTRAVFAVPLYGHPADTEGLQEAIDDAPWHGSSIDLLEDAAEAAGAKVWVGDDHARGRMCGSLGRAAAFGFYGNKVLTCGEGGMVTTDDEWLADHVRSLRSYCFDPRYHFWHAEIGHSMRMQGLAAALLSAQIDRAEQLVTSRTERARWYAKHLSEATVDSFPESAVRCSWWHYWVRCSHRAEVRAELARLGYETRPGFTPTHVQPCYRTAGHRCDEFGRGNSTIKWPSRATPCPEAERAGREVLLLPTHCGVTERHVEEICGVVNRM